jgi:uncharacterized delta-60 repeat protein/gliding motility-associated-like protein
MNTLLRIRNYLAIAFLLLSLLAHAQYPELDWAQSVGSSSTDNGLAITTDAVGNVYVTGSFSGTVDFDPGAGITNLTSSGSVDIFVTKFDAAGNLVWAKKMGGTSSDIGKAIAVDATGNVYLTGHFSTTADFDPGVGINNLTSSGNWDAFVCKLDVNGDFVWAGSLGGLSFDMGNGLAVDASNNVVVVGQFTNSGDFDPGAGTTTLSSAGLDDVFMVKLNRITGNLIWAKQIGDIGGDQALAVTVDASDNILTTGVFANLVDFDPGTGTFSLTGNGNDAFVLKLDTNGDFVWAAGMGGNNDDVGRAIKVDATGNVYSTGYFVYGDGTPHDFDPGVGVFNLTPTPAFSLSNKDIYISKLTSAGNFVWAKQLGGVGSEEPFALALDASANVYSTGTFNGTVDFDPSSSTFSFTATGFSNIYLSKLNSSGDFVWAEKPVGTYAGFGRGIVVSTTNEVIITGSFDSTVDFSAGSCDFSLTTNGQSDIFIQKLNQSGAPPPIIASFTPAVGLDGTVVTITGFNFDPVPANNIVKFNGTLAVVTSSTATSITTSVPVGTTTGFITIEIGCASGISSTPYTFSTCVPPSQRNALIELYNSTDGPNWTSSNNWTSIDESTWFGVTVTGCNITEISLPSNNLNGYLPFETGDLLYLQRLDLSDNNLYYGIPSEIGNFNNLQYLFLQSNQLDGSIPPELSNLSSLIEVSFSNNRLSGVAPAIGLASMSMSDVSLEGNYFNELADVTGYYNLNSFSIGNNSLSFEDLEPNAAVSNFTYSPQAKLPPGGIVSFTVGGNLTIPFTTPGSANNYQWYKNGVLLPGATSATLSIPSAVVGDAGTYHVLVNNSIATGVTLQSYDYVAIADPCTSATRIAGFIDAAFQPNFDNPTSVSGVAIQSTGKIIASVPNTTVGGFPVFGTIRFNSNGTLDGTFNQIPEQTIPLIQPDDKILGYANDQVIRYNADGTDDFAFNINAPQSYSSSLSAMALQPDGKIVYSITAHMGTMGIIRLNADGTTDLTFPNLSYLASALEVQPDGKILVAGLSGSLNRLNPDGSADASFDAGTPPIHSINDLLVQPDGKIIVVGKFTSVQGNNRFGIVRLNTDGSLDGSFSAQGIADLATFIGPYRVALMSNGKLIVAGDFANVNGSQKKNLVRLNTDGTIDCSFDPGLSTSNPIAGLALQANNEIVISGDFITYDGTTRNGLARVSNGTGSVLTIATHPADVTACAGSLVSFTTAATGAANITYQWQFSTTLAGVYNDIANGGGYSGASTATLAVTTTASFGTGFYRCKVNGDFAATAFSNEAGLSVIVIPTAPTATAVNSCGPGTIVLSASGGTNGQYRWYTTSTGGTPIAGQTNSTFTTPLLSVTTTFFVSIDNGNCESTRTPVIATVNTIPLAPATIAASSCDPGTIVLSASGGTNGQYRWYTTSTGGTPIAGQTNSTFTTPLLSVTTTFFVSIDNGTCESTRTSVTATINTIPLAPATIAASSCGPSTIILNASGGTNGQYRWYTTSTGGTPISGQTGSTFTTPLLSVTTTFFVSIDDGNCESTRTAVTATVNTIPLAPATIAASSCGPSTIILNASGGTNGQYRWYTTSTGGTAIAGQTNSAFTTPFLSLTTTFFVSIDNGTCESTRTPATATINTSPAPTATGASACLGSTVTLTAAGGTNGQYKWYIVATGGTAIAGETSNTFQISSLTVTSTFYVSLTISGCESARTAVMATLLATGCAPVISAQTFTTQVEGKIEINLQSLITTPGTLDPTSIKIVTQPASDAIASITNFVLTIDYKGKPFSGKESVTIEACNTNGLCSQQVFTIEVAGEVIVFNAVSSNGDDKNEFLVLQFIESISPKNQVSIYNRWGDEVFSISDYDNKTRVFAGLTSGGNKLPSGTYFYKILLADAGKTLTGFISLK